MSTHDEDYCEKHKSYAVNQGNEYKCNGCIRDERNEVISSIAGRLLTEFSEKERWEILIDFMCTRVFHMATDRISLLFKLHMDTAEKYKKSSHKD